MTRATLTLVALLAAPAGFAQEEHDHDHDHAPRIQVAEAGPGDPQLEAAIYAELAQPVVDSYREQFRTAASPDALRTPLRALVGRIHDTVAARLPGDVANRQTVARNVREKFTAAIEEVASTPAARSTLHTLVEEAAEEDISARREHLWGVIMCWCPREKWTRTLAGCPDACADEQKGMVSAWIAEGRTSDEIVELMVADPRGGEKVRGYLKATGVNRLGYLLPTLFLVTALVVLNIVLLRVIRRRGEPGAPSSDGGGTPSREGTEDEERWGEEIEKELREMDS